MGAIPKLNKKVELKYRKGSTNESRNFRYCVHFVPNQAAEQSVCLGHVDGRCLIFGLNEGIRYRVWSDYACDAQYFDETKRTW